MVGSCWDPEKDSNTKPVTGVTVIGVEGVMKCSCWDYFYLPNFDDVQLLL